MLGSLTSMAGAIDGPYILTNMRKILKLFSSTSSYIKIHMLLKLELGKSKGTAIKFLPWDMNLPHSQTYSIAI